MLKIKSTLKTRALHFIATLSRKKEKKDINTVIVATVEVA